MAKLGIVSDEQFNKELINSQVKPVVNNGVSKVLEGEIIEKREIGRGTGNNQVPEGLRKLIGEESVIRGRQSALELARDFGISDSSVSAYAKGATSTTTYNEPDQGLTKYLTARKNKVTKKALRVLQSSLDTLTPEKLQNIKARDAASIAKDMSVIAKNMEPESGNNDQVNGPKFVVYAPTIRDERSYETVIVSDNY